MNPRYAPEVFVATIRESLRRDPNVRIRAECFSRHEYRHVSRLLTDKELERVQFLWYAFYNDDLDLGGIGEGQL